MAKLPIEYFDHEEYQESLVSCGADERALMLAHPQDVLYLHKPSGLRGVITGYEAATIHLHVCTRYNQGHERCYELLFVHPDLLEECDIQLIKIREESAQEFATVIAKALTDALGGKVEILKVQGDELDKLLNGNGNSLKPH